MKPSPRWYLALIFTFLLGIHEGFIALWTGDDPHPAVIFPYSAASLPPADARALAQGIPLEDTDRLEQLLEDYLS